MIPAVVFHHTSFYRLHKNGPNKLECYITLGWKGLPRKNTLADFTHSQVMKKMKCFEYGPRSHSSQYFIFFITYKWAQ
jgi:hypothetical protein